MRVYNLGLQLSPMMMDITPADLIDTQTGQFLGCVSLVGEAFLSTPWINVCGRLQDFVILSEADGFWEAWYNQEDLLLKTDQMQWLVKIITYPTEGENQGMLSYVRTLEKVDRPVYREPVQARSRRWLNVLQTILGV